MEESERSWSARGRGRGGAARDSALAHWRGLRGRPRPRPRQLGAVDGRDEVVWQRPHGWLIGEITKNVTQASPRLYAKFNYRIKWFDGWGNHKSSRPRQLQLQTGSALQLVGAAGEGGGRVTSQATGNSPQHCSTAAAASGRYAAVKSFFRIVAVGGRHAVIAVHTLVRSRLGDSCAG